MVDSALSLEFEAMLASDGVRPALQRRSQATFERFLDAAEELIARHGVEDTSMAAVAEAAGSSVGALYTRFADKTALVRAVQIRQLRRQIGGAATVFDDTDPATVAAPVAVLVERFIATLVHGFASQAGLIRAIIIHGARDPVMRERASLTISEATRTLTARLIDRADEFTHPDPVVAGDVVVRIVTSVLQQTLLLDRPLPEARLLAELTRAAWAYLGCDPLAQTGPGRRRRKWPDAKG